MASLLADPRPTPARGRRKRAGPVLALTVAGVALLFSAPFVYLIAGALGSGSRFWEVLTSGDIARPLFNSLLLGSSVAAMTMVVGTGLAVLVGRCDLPGRGAWRVALALPLVIPSFVGATALIAATGRGGLIPVVPRPGGFWGSFLVLVLFTYPYVFLPVLAKIATTPRPPKRPPGCWVGEPGTPRCGCSCRNYGQRSPPVGSSCSCTA